MTAQTSILLVDDDRAHRIMLKVNLEQESYRIFECDDGDQVLSMLEKHAPHLILMDQKMARMDGLEALELIKKKGYTIPVILLTAFSSVKQAVSAMKNGAFDYITKPIDIEELLLLINRALTYEQIEQENRQLKERIGEQFSFSNIIGNCSSMQDLFQNLRIIAPTDATVLITGESGTGKELIANALHENSLRKDNVFIKLNCAALNENLLESELFGHEAGAFTGANKQRKGRFELANGGTLFLDEIGDMSLPTQAKILRVLQEGEFERLGGSTTIQVDVRVLAATHKNLEDMISEGLFRQDLYYRLSVVPVELPPLRSRSTDIPELCNHFLRKYAQKNKKDIQGIHPEALSILTQYNWPGNIRELENTIERAVILCQGEYVSFRELPTHMVPKSLSDNISQPDDPQFTLRDMEREVIRSTLALTNNNKSETAKKLGIARQTLLNKIKEYDL
ncbi:sigma-54-dependent transcriptional regulator [Desulfogranum japonicum]|uniref:sigma-54-dependent transcriptional regulator n=1 Tax=Desulfogranum japonicum TaxID=231447 RepID=UPI00040A75C9|nr:sigma-54 dependent transcriptional regulator [Desulfogranum japonicum]